MANMSYCRFENTLADLQDCFDHLDDFDNGELSKSEAHAAYKLIILAAQIAESYGDDDLKEFYAQYTEE
jgi:hypothetical protein